MVAEPLPTCANKSESLMPTSRPASISTKAAPSTPTLARTRLLTVGDSIRTSR